MLKVLFFGRVRDELGCDALQVPWEEKTAELDSLQRLICEQHGQKWKSVLGQENIIRAVNHQVVGGNPVLEDGDEVAFFPPVTGG